MKFLDDIFKILNVLEEFMTEKLELYRCSVCGNLVQVFLNGVGELNCCGQPMELLLAHHEENSELAEKHTPEIECIDNKRYVILKHHPMEEEHYIQFIEVYAKDKSRLCLKFLNPNEKAEMNITYFEENIEALEYCNIHGLWEKRSNND